MLKLKPFYCHDKEYKWLWSKVIAIQKHFMTRNENKWMNKFSRQNFCIFPSGEIHLLTHSLLHLPWHHRLPLVPLKLVKMQPPLSSKLHSQPSIFLGGGTGSSLYVPNHILLYKHDFIYIYFTLKWFLQEFMCYGSLMTHYLLR